MSHEIVIERFSWLATLLGFSLCLGGCQKAPLPTFPVQGQVIFSDGVAVQAGWVEFHSIKHQISSQGSITSDGKFSLTTFRQGDGAVDGEHEVIVTQDLSQFSPERNQSGTAHFTPHRRVHARYQSYNTSKLTASVRPQRKNEVVITLEWSQ